MREDDGAVHVVVTVDRVDAVNEGDLQAGLERVGLQLIVSLRPALGGFIGGTGTAAAEERADEILLDVAFVVLDGIEVDLDHLADLLVDGHLLEQRLDLGVGGFFGIGSADPGHRGQNKHER